MSFLQFSVAIFNIAVDGYLHLDYYFKILILVHIYPSNQPVTQALFSEIITRYPVQNVLAMQTQDPKAEIAALEIKCFHYKRLLAKAILDNVELLKTKIIYRKLKAVTKRLEELRKLEEKK
jgi:hypothetical protein